MVKRIFVIIFSLWVVLPLISQTWADFELNDEERLSLETQRTPTLLKPCSEDKRSEDTLHFDGPNFIGLGFFPYPIAAVRFTPETAGTLIAVIFYYYEDITHNVSANVYEEGTPTHPGSLVIVESYSVTDSGWYRINLSQLYPYSAGVDFWTAIEMVDYIGPEYPFGVDAGPAEVGRGDWISYDAGATWEELWWWGYDLNWNIRAIVHLEGGGVEELRGKQQQKARLEVYPNPFTKATNVQLIGSNKNTSSNLTIFDASGRLMKSVKIETDTHQLGADLVPGIYFLKLNGKPVGKVVKVR